MSIAGIDTKCYILALFVRDDNKRFLLGSGHYEFQDSQLHFSANSIENDVVNVQGNDGYLLAGQVRRPGVQNFDGFIGDGTTSKENVEERRREFFKFFRKGYFYKVIYIFPNGNAIQRKRGFLVDDATVEELYQQYPKYHVALNFEDVNYYSYSEDASGEEIYAKEAEIRLSTFGGTGGLIWDAYGVVWEDVQWSGEEMASGREFMILNQTEQRAPITDIELYGDTFQQTYSGKNICSKIIKYNNNSVAFYVTDIDLLNEYLMLEFECSTILETTLSSVYAYRADAVGDNLGNVMLGSIETTRTGKNILPIKLSSSIIREGVEGGGLQFRVYKTGLWNDTVVDDIKEAQIEQGSTATSYEPYTGGIPAPNPDYPQDINVVTGEQTVEVAGKNLLDSLNGYANKNINNEGGYENGGGTNALFGYIRVNSSTEYTISQIENGYFSRYWVAYFDSSQSIISRERMSGLNAGTFTTPINCAYVRIWVYRVDGATQEALEYAKLQLEQGSTATDYEPYQSQSYPISLTGKNLFNYKATPIVANDASYSNGGLVTATSSGTGKYVMFRLVGTNNYVGSKLTLSCDTMHPSSTNNGRVEFGVCNADGSNKTVRGVLGNAPAFASYTVQEADRDKYFYISLYASYSASANVGDSVTYGNVQLERGDRTSYAPYSPIELCKIGDYQDYIYKGDDGWYVHKEIGGKIFDGSESWGWNNNQVFTLNLGDFFANGTTTAPYSNNFIGQTTTGFSQVLDKHISLQSNGATGSERVLIRYLDLEQKTDAFKTWLSTHNTTLYYPLATPTDTKITDEMLVGQLEAINAFRLFVGENNWLVTTDDVNLAGDLEIKYRTEIVSNGGAEWEEGEPGGPVTIDVDSIDTVYPVWTVTGPATNPQISVLTTGTTLSYTGTVTATQTLVIDMLNKTATLNGANVTARVTGDWINFIPGANRVSYTSVNADAEPSKIEWQEVVG